MRLMLLGLVGAACAGPASAHDFWIQPAAFSTVPGAVLAATLQVGHGPARQRSPIPLDRITGFRSVGPDGTLDQSPGLALGRQDADADLRFSAPGSYVIALETNDAVTSLPAIRFNDYIKAEHLTPAIERRRATGSEDAPGREFYSRRAKAIIAVGPPGSGPSPQVTAPVGLTLEIVPERDPTRLRTGEPLPVRVLFEGAPLADALVKLTDLDADERPVEEELTDAAGRAAFTLPRSGSWLLNVVWTRPIPPNRTADYVTTFSSLTFGVADAAR